MLRTIQARVEIETERLPIGSTTYPNFISVYTIMLLCAHAAAVQHNYTYTVYHTSIETSCMQEGYSLPKFVMHVLVIEYH